MAMRRTPPTLRNATLTLARAPLRHQRSYHASVLPSLVQTGTPEYTAKESAMNELVADLDAKLQEARLGGGAKAAERMRGKGKLLPRER